MAKRSILSRFGSNLIWDEKNLIITPYYAIQALIDGLNDAKAKNGQFEPKNTLAHKDKTDVFASVSHGLRRALDNVRKNLMDAEVKLVRP
jgi:hypothetical protein